MKLRQKLAIRLQLLAIRLYGSEFPKVPKNMPTERDFGTPQETKGKVIEASKRDQGWKPHQSGGVITAEPDMMTAARERGEKVDEKS